jgi:predicted small integral membrane protein
MKVVARVFTHLLFACGFLVFIAMPANKYAWMQEIDPSISALPADDGAGNRSIFTLLLSIVIVAAQLGIVITSASKKEKVISIVLVLVAISAWLLRFWQ